MKWFALVLLSALQISCTTLENRRDLYSPEPGPESRERAKQLAGKQITTTTTTTTTTTRPEEGPVAPPQFR